MFWFLGLFDPGWRDFSVRVSNTEVTILWILAAVLGAVAYHFFFARKATVSVAHVSRLESLEKELQDERSRHHKIKGQLDAALSKSNSFAAAAHELEKLKARMQELQKELNQVHEMSGKYKLDFENEHAKVTSMIVDHSEVEALRNRVRNQEKDLQRSTVELATAKTELNAALSEKLRLSAALDESQMVDLNNRISKLENDLQSSRLMVIKYQSDVARMEEDRKREAAGIPGADQTKNEAEIATLTDENKKLKEKLAQSTKALEDQKSLPKASSEMKITRKAVTITPAPVEHAPAPVPEAVAVAEPVTVEPVVEAVPEAMAEPVVEAGPAAVAEPVPVVTPDDLKRIEGIGPKLEEIFISHDILTFSQLAATKIEDLQAILDKAGDAYRIHNPGTWPQQAQLLAEGRIEEFQKLTDELKGGRKVD
jgi:predicted flap endonuclease-1-like 5' DNA nuclease